MIKFVAFAALLGVCACAHADAPAEETVLYAAVPKFAPDSGVILPDSARSQRRGLPSLGIDVGAYFPTSGKTRSAFGSRWTSIGPGIGFTVVNSPKIDPDFEILRQDKGGNDASVILAGARLLFPLSKPLVTAAIPSFAPYAGVGLNLNYINIDAPDFNSDDKGFGVGGSAVLGASLGRRLFAEARYRVFTEKADFNLSGAQLVVGARF